jgi:hypothetical protein
VIASGYLCKENDARPRDLTAWAALSFEAFCIFNAFSKLSRIYLPFLTLKNKVQKRKCVKSEEKKKGNNNS